MRTLLAGVLLLIAVATASAQDRPIVRFFKHLWPPTVYGKRQSPPTAAPPCPPACPQHVDKAFASAFEKDGVITIELDTYRNVTETIVRKVPYTKTGFENENGVTRQVTRTAYQDVVEQATRQVKESHVLIADGKQVQVTRKDGEPIPRRELPRLLDKTPVLFTTAPTLDREVIESLGGNTLIIRKVASPPTFCTAIAYEKDGIVILQVVVVVQQPYTVSRRVAESTPQRIVTDGEERMVSKLTYRAVNETEQRASRVTHRLVADGNNVHVTRGDGSEIEPSTLPTLLKQEHCAILIWDSGVDPGQLRDVGPKTLIIRARRDASKPASFLLDSPAP